MAKSTKPDRKQGNRRKKEPAEFAETTLAVDRVSRVVAGGRRMRFRATVVAGDRKGKVGLGTGKANDVQSAVQKATQNAKKNMVRVPLQEGTIPHEIDTKFKAARIRLLPAREGTGVIAGGALRVVLEHAGIRNVLSKRFGTNNKLVNAQCVLQALRQLRQPAGSQQETAEEETVTQQAAESEEDNESREGMEVQEVSKDDVDREGNLTGSA